MLTTHFQSSWSHIIDLLPHNIKGRRAGIRTQILGACLTVRRLVVQMVFNKVHHLRVRYSDTHSPLLSKGINFAFWKFYLQIKNQVVLLPIYLVWKLRSIFDLVFDFESCRVCFPTYFWTLQDLNPHPKSRCICNLCQIPTLYLLS